MSRSITPAPTPPQTITVSTAAGFNAGDLVYFNGSTGDYGTPTPAGVNTSVQVAGSAIQPLLGSTTEGSYTSVVDGVYGSCYTKRFAAALTNNNIVQVFFNVATNEPSFRIVDAAGAVVVATTSISATYIQGSNPNISVAALTGGGFVVAWINGGGGTVLRPCYAVYDNAGTVVAAAGQDLGGTGAGLAASPIQVVATPSGGFVIAYYSSASTIINARGYAANGTASFAWVSLSGVTNNSGIIGLAVRSNGDFLLAGLATGSSNGLYAIWSSVGAGIIGSTTLPSTNGSFGSQTAFDACCLSNGTTFVIAYTASITAVTLAFRFLPTGNVLGSEFYVPRDNISGNNLGAYNMLSVTPLTSNRFIIFGVNGTTNLNACYAVFNSSGVCLSGTSGTTSTAAKPINVLGSYLAAAGLQPAVFQAASGLISVYYLFNIAKAYSLAEFTISETTYEVNIIAPTATVKPIGFTSQAAALYQPSVSTPLAAGFSITPGTYPVNYTFATVIKTPEIVNDSSTHCSCATLPDGRMLVAYITTSSLVKVAVYSVDGVLTQTLSIATNGTSNTSNPASLVDIAAMTGGGFVITYVTNAGATFNTYLYSSAFAQVGSAITTSGSGTIGTSFPRVAGISGDRYVLAYTNATNQPSYSIYDNTNSVIINAALINSAAHGYIFVSPFANDGFLIGATLSSSSIQWYGTWANPSNNTFTAAVVWVSTGGSANIIPNNRAASNSNGAVVAPRTTSTTNYSAVAYTTVGQGGLPTISSGTLLDIPNNDGVAVGFTGLGNTVITGLTTGPLINIRTAVTGLTALSATVFIPRTTPQISITPGYGPTFGMVYVDSSSRVRFAIIADSTVQNAAITTAEICTPVAISPGTTSASPGIPNTVFTGVALQTVPAGGAGTVQVAGTALLGSTYPAGTTYRAFDHQSQGVPGVKGTITGRAITLQGT